MPFLSKAWSWFTNNQLAQIVAAFVLALIGWGVVRRNIEETGRIKERERNAAAQAAEQRRIDEAIRQQNQENQDARERADQAVSDVPIVRRTDELRDKSPRDYEILIDPARSGGQ